MITLLFTLEYPPFKGGVANYYGNMVRYWPKIASVHLGLEEDDPDTKLRVLHNNDGALLWNWFYPKWLPSTWLLKGAVNRQSVEHIIVGHILPLGTVTYNLNRKTGIPYTVILHGMDLAMAMRPGRKQMIAKRVLLGATNIICGNTYTAELALKHMGDKIRSKIFVVNPGINPSFVVKKEKVDHIKRQYNLENKTVLFSCGRLQKRKGFENVIKVMPDINKDYPDLHYFIAGDGPRKMEIHGHSMNNKNITYLGRISDEEKNAWLALCDTFIMPSFSQGEDFEGFGIVYLEANIAGKPVIAGRSGGVSDAVEDGVNGLLVDPESPSAIKDAIIKLISDTALRTRLGQQGRDRALEKFNWMKQVTEIYKIINR